MAHRKVRDRVGREWDVWEVVPTAIDRRMRDDPRIPDRRRIDTGFAARVNERLKDGWLAFQTTHEKRRLTPVPPDWETMTDAEILALLERSTKAGKPTRLIE